MPEPVKEKKGDPGPKVYSVNLDAETTPEVKKMVVKVINHYLPKEELQNVENK